MRVRLLFTEATNYTILHIPTAIKNRPSVPDILTPWAEMVKVVKE